MFRRWCSGRSASNARRTECRAWVALFTEHPPRTIHRPFRTIERVTYCERHPQLIMILGILRILAQDKATNKKPFVASAYLSSSCGPNTFDCIWLHSPSATLAKSESVSIAVEGDGVEQMDKQFGDGVPPVAIFFYLPISILCTLDLESLTWRTWREASQKLSKGTEFSLRKASTKMKRITNGDHRFTSVILSAASLLAGSS